MKRQPSQHHNQLKNVKAPQHLFAQQSLEKELPAIPRAARLQHHLTNILKMAESELSLSFNLTQWVLMLLTQRVLSTPGSIKSLSFLIAEVSLQRRSLRA